MDRKENRRKGKDGYLSITKGDFLHFGQLCHKYDEFEGFDRIDSPNCMNLLCFPPFFFGRFLREHSHITSDVFLVFLTYLHTIIR